MQHTVQCAACCGFNVLWVMPPNQAGDISVPQDTLQTLMLALLNYEHHRSLHNVCPQLQKWITLLPDFEGIKYDGNIPPGGISWRLGKPRVMETASLPIGPLS